MSTAINIDHSRYEEAHGTPADRHPCFRHWCFEIAGRTYAVGWCGWEEALREALAIAQRHNARTVVVVP